jgi:D-alanyl-D-alanine carboxypeptidase
MFYKTNPILNEDNKMKLGKFTNLFCLLFVCLCSFSAISYKASSTEPTVSVLTADNIAKIQAASDTLLMTTKTPGFMVYIGVEGEGDGIYITRGVGNLVTGEPMNINNNWRIGSITKTINAEAVLILADEGKIDLSKPISFYLPELNIPSGDKITIRMLGNMTSGLFNYTDDADFWTLLTNSHGQTGFTPEKLVAAAFSHPMMFEPGTKYYYCNTNFILLGLLIKKVTGKADIAIFNEKIFQPLGMKNTFWPSTRYLPYPYTHGYSLNTDSSIIDISNWNPSWADAAGILTSNFTDLKIWAKELADRKLLSDKMKAERFGWVDSEPVGIKYSGFGLEKLFDWVGHPGSLPGYNSEVFYNTVKKITIIVSANSVEGAPADDILISIMNILTPFNLNKKTN